MSEMLPQKDELVAMAVAVAAQELGTDVNHIRVHSFREVKKSSLAQYLEDNHINFVKYELGM